MHITPHGWTVLSQVATVVSLFVFAFGGHKWIKKNIVEPLRAVQHFTTQNGNKEENQENPTLRDDLHTIKTELVRQGEVQEAQGEDLKTQQEMIVQHLAWSTEETSRLWKAIGKKQDG